MLNKQQQKEYGLVAQIKQLESNGFVLDHVSNVYPISQGDKPLPQKIVGIELQFVKELNNED